MAFASPLLIAAGACLIAVPIVLHLIMQQKPKNFVFPALRFVKERISTNQRRLRVRHWLLLLLRCIGIFLVALAFAQPSVASNLFGTWLTIGGLSGIALLLFAIMAIVVYVSRPVPKLLFGMIATVFVGVVGTIGSIYFSAVSDNPVAALGNDQSPVSAVLIIDTSPRMLYEIARQTEGDQFAQAESRLAEAQGLADWLVRELPDDSDICIVDSSADEPFNSVDVAAAAKRISSLSIASNSVSIPDRMNAAIDFLETGEQKENKPREIYIFTDMTLKSWQSKRSKQLQLRLNDLKDISVYLVDISVENPTNYQLDELELSSETMAVGGGINLLVRTLRYGPPGERPLELVMDKVDPRRPSRRDGKTILPEEKRLRIAAISIEENGVAETSFSVNDLSNGVHHGVVRIQGADSLAIDNERYFTIDVREPWKILLVRPVKTDELENDVSAETVSVVLSPDELVEMGQAKYDCIIIDQEGLLDQKLSDYSAVFLLDPKPMPDTAWTNLKKFASAGGGVAVLLGENAKTGFGVDDSFGSPEAQQLLGGELTEVWTPPSVFFSNADYSHPVMAKYKRFETEDVWRDFEIYQHWGLIDSEFEPANLRTILRFSNNQPAVIDRKIGDGKALTILTPFTEPGRVVGRARWNDLTNGEWWPAALLIDQVAGYLVSSKNNRLNYQVGENVVLRELTKSDGTIKEREFLLYPPRNEEPSDLVVVENEIRYRFTETPGNYRLKAVGVSNSRRGFSVNLSRDDTDLTQINEKTLDESLGMGRYKLAKSKEDIVREQSYVREGKKFFPLLLTIFGVIVIVELFMSNLFYRGI